MSKTSENISEKSIKFGDKKVTKSDVYKKDTKLFKIDGIGVDKILISKKEIYGQNKSYKYFKGYNDNDEIIPLIIRLPQIIDYFKCFNNDNNNKSNNNNNNNNSNNNNNNNNNNKTIFFKVSGKKQLKNYIKIWKKVSELMKIKFDSEPIYGMLNV